jgi:hypothetical protein
MLAQEVADKAQERQEAWDRAVGRLEQFDRESLDAIDEQIKLLDPVFEEAKGGAKAFANDVLGGWGKLKYGLDATNGALNGMWNGVCDLFGKKESKLVDTDPNRYLNEYARDAFNKHIDPDMRITQAVIDARSGYLSKLPELENRAMTDLGIDLADGAIGPFPSPPSLDAELGTFWGFWSKSSGLVDNAGADLLVTSARWIASEMIANKLTEDQPSGIRKFATSQVVSGGANDAIGAGMRMGGYNPEGRIIARTEARLDAIRAGIVFGSKVGGQSDTAYVALNRQRLANPDPEVRTACEQAIGLMEQCFLPVGLRAKLLAIHHQRSIGLKNAIFRSIFGADAALPASIHIGVGGNEEETIKWAKAWSDFCRPRVPANGRGPR